MHVAVHSETISNSEPKSVSALIQSCMLSGKVTNTQKSGMGAKLCFLPYLFDKTFRQNGNNKCIVNFRAFCLFFFKPNGVFILLVVFLFFACQFLKTCPHPHFQCRFEAYSTTPTFRWASKAPPTFRATSEACPLSLSKLPHFRSTSTPPNVTNKVIC